ncbi:MAG: hypothetical protein JXP34_26495 [Planctomycetes bacterium]|nr:hypothetical protein [Planctomycetota bacterium]
MLSMPLLLTTLSLAAAGAPDIDRPIAEWDFSRGDPLGWRATHDLAPFRFPDGSLLLTITGTDPYAVGPEIAFETTAYQYILVDLESSIAGDGEIFWAEGPGPTQANFRAEAARGFSIAKGRQLAVVVPFWTPGRKVWRIRLDLPSKPGESARVRRIAIRERLADGPPPDDLGFEFARPEEAAWWTPFRDLERLTVRRGSLTAEAAGPNPAILAPPLAVDIAVRPYLSFRLAAPGAHGVAVLVRREETGGFPPGIRTDIDLVPGAGTHAYNIDLRSLPGLEGGTPETKVHRIAIVAPGARRVLLDGIRVASEPSGPAEPCVASVETLGTVLEAGAPVEIDVEIRNHGGAPAEKLSLRANFIGAPEKAIAVDPIPPVGFRRVRVPLRAPAEPGRHVLSVELAGPGIEPSPFERAVVVVDEVGPDAPAAGDSTRVIESGPLRLVVAGSDGRWTACVLWLRRGEGWVRLGASSDLGRIDSAAWKGPLSGTIATASDGGWTLRRPFPGLACEIAFLPEKPPIDGAGLIRVRLTLKAEQPLVVRNLALPSLGIGDGSFGATKKIALLPGLEYAIGGERTSGSDFCVPDLASRVVPHPYKVTIPLAAVIAGGVSAGWLWDPSQATHPAVVFASPNFLRGEANHFATLAWPGVGDGRDENEILPAARRLLPEGESVAIEAFLFGMPAEDVDGPFGLWIARRGGVPEPPPIPFDYAKVLDAVAVELTRITWVERESAWHRALPDPWKPAFLEPNALFLAWRLAIPAPAGARAPSGPGAFAWAGLDGERAKAAQEILEKACRKRLEAAPRGSWGQDLSFLFGGVADALRGLRAHAAALAARIRKDGSIPFAPDAAHAVFGRAGDSSSGLTARAILPIADYARRTGDPKAVDALVKALEYINGCLRPEGAQTWELPLHVPDVLAAADAVALNLVAFQETGDEAYRAHARRWAFRGLPFIYLWNGNDRPIMRYGSIPVFGATWYTSPWFGRIVQWNGLVYAQALLELARVDRSADWAAIARGIVHSAIGQARPLDPAASPLRDRVPDCGHTGMYPDAYSAVDGTDAYHWCLSGLRVVEALAHVAGDSPWPETAIAKIGGVRIRVTAPGAWVERPRAEGGALRFALRIPAEGPRWILVAGGGKPSAVTIDGAAIPEAADAGDGPDEPWNLGARRALGPAWRWIEPDGWVIIRASGRGEAKFEISYPE